MLLVKMMVLMKMMVNIAMNDGDTRRLIFQLYWNIEDVFCACSIFLLFTRIKQWAIFKCWRQTGHLCLKGFYWEKEVKYMWTPDDKGRKKTENAKKQLPQRPCTYLDRQTLVPRRVEVETSVMIIIIIIITTSILIITLLLMMMMRMAG